MNTIRYLKASFNTLRFGALGGMLLHLRDRRTVFFQCMQAAILLLMVCPDCVSAEPKNEKQKQAINLAPGSAHPGTTGEVKLELEGFFLEGDPHACGIIWDVAVDEQKGELFVLCEPKRVGGVGEVRVFDRSGAYKRTIMPLNPTLPQSKVQDICQNVVGRGNRIDCSQV